MTEIKVLGIKKAKNKKPIAILRITLDNETHVIASRVLPKCYGEWHAWFFKGKRTTCSLCIFEQSCKDYLARRLVAQYEIEKREYNRRMRMQ